MRQGYNIASPRYLSWQPNAYNTCFSPCFCGERHFVSTIVQSHSCLSSNAKEPTASSEQPPLKVSQWLCCTGLIDSRQTNPRSNYEHQERPVCSYDVFIIPAENRHREPLLGTEMIVSVCSSLNCCLRKKASSTSSPLIPTISRQTWIGIYHLQCINNNNTFYL